MRVWQEAGAGYMFVLRGGLFVQPLSERELAHLLRFVVDPNTRVLGMIHPPIANIDIDAFAQPVEHGKTAVSRAPLVVGERCDIDYVELEHTYNMKRECVPDGPTIESDLIRENKLNRSHWRQSNSYVTRSSTRENLCIRQAGQSSN